MTWLWIGSTTIVISTALQVVALYRPSLFLGAIGLILNAISVPFTIVQAYRSAVEQQRLFEKERREREERDQFVYSRTPEGKILSSLMQLRREMHMDDSEHLL